MVDDDLVDNCVFSVGICVAHPYLIIMNIAVQTKPLLARLADQSRSGSKLVNVHGWSQTVGLDLALYG
jgi:hypothetical protein